METTNDIVSRLEKLGIPVATFEGIAGCVATIQGGRPGKTVLLRADPDVPRGCQTKMLLAAAGILNEQKEEQSGTVKLLFQMEEKNGRESEAYVEQGVLEGVDAIFGMGVSSLLEKGRINVEPGERMACADRFVIRIHGVAAHGSAPYQGKDAIVAAAACVMALQTLPSRINDPANALEVTVGMMNGGTKENIIASEVELEGTIRTFQKEFRNSLPERLEHMVKPLAQAYGCGADCDYYFGPGPLINEWDDLTALAQRTAKKILGENCLIPMPKQMEAEDFGVYLEHIPGVYVCLGSGREEKDFDVDEEVLANGTALYVQFAKEFLDQN